MAEIYKVAFLLRTPDGISQANVEEWLGEFCVKHKVFMTAAGQQIVKHKRNVQ